MALHRLNLVRRKVTSVTRRVALLFGVRKNDINYYRDVSLGVPVTVAVILASTPVFRAMDGRSVLLPDLASGFFWLVVAISICLLSINWNQILAGAFGFLFVRGLAAIILSRGQIRVVLLTLVFLGVALVIARIKPEKL